MIERLSKEDAVMTLGLFPPRSGGKRWSGMWRPCLGSRGAYLSNSVPMVEIQLAKTTPSVQ